VDSVFVCRHRERATHPVRFGPATLQRWLARDRDALARGGVRATSGDLRCLELGHLARVAVARLTEAWQRGAPPQGKLDAARDVLRSLEARASSRSSSA